MNQIQTANLNVIHPDCREEFGSLFQEFLDTFSQTEKGQTHFRSYAALREIGQKNCEIIQNMISHNEPVTDMVLLKLLPYSDTPGNRARGAWIHIAPVFSGDIRSKFEGIGWTMPESWDPIAIAIVEFIHACQDNPDNLEIACQKFTNLPITKGFQTGTLTPILNALCPDAYVLINNKSRRVINHFAKTDFQQTLLNYPDTNKLALQLRSELAAMFGIENIVAGDLFDMFTHWLVSIKRFFKNDNGLGSPISKIFADMDQAIWAMRWLRFTAENLGIKGPDDLRVAITLPKADNPKSLHFIFGNWLVLGFCGRRGNLEMVQMALVEDIRKEMTDVRDTNAGKYTISPGDVPIFLYDIPLESFRENEDQIERGFVETLKVIKPYFETWKASNLRDTHNHLLAKAVFDEQQEESILKMNLIETPEPSVDVINPPSMNISSKPAFSVRAFELLEGIHQEPRVSFYTEHKAEFKSEIEQPFQEVLHNVASRLPDDITNRMETKKNIVSRFAKNDFGQGGAWSFYWGAFYPKGAKRTTDAQLALFWNRQSIQISFYIADYASDVRARFKYNCGQHREILPTLLADLVNDPSFLLIPDDDEIIIQVDGRVEPKNSIPWEGFFANPAQTNYGVRLTLSRAQVLSMEAQDFENLVLSTFQRLYPLVLLSKENALDELRSWLVKDEPYMEDAEIKPYSLDDCVRDTGFDYETLDCWQRAIERKKQAILYGPPGTGKTFIARALAKVLTNGNDDLVELVQFHPAYSYEDFMQGIRPRRVDGGLDYPTLPGRFLEFCRRAQDHDKPAVLIIDEINRANLARVFGELMYLLEYRDEEIPLAGGGRFRIPANVRIIGTMNTADRSIALVDHALRRRFAFLSLRPNYDVLQKFHERKASGFPIDRLITVLKNLNSTINEPHYEVGISFFLRENLAEEILDIWKMEIEPYLEEYFFEDDHSVDSFRWDSVKPQLGL